MTDENYVPIAGTAGLPDNRIHRASLWLERMKFGERAFTREMDERHVESQTQEENSLLFRELEMEDITPRDVQLASMFYGRNLQHMLFGNRVQIMMPTPVHGEKGQVNFGDLLAMVWRDGFEHGAAARAGKHAFTDTEIRERGGADD